MNIRLAIDVMGGDKAPQALVSGIAIAALRYPGVEFILFGDQPVVQPLVESHDILKGRVQYIHTDEIVTAEMKPAHAIRRLPKSSMRLAIKAVAEGEAQGVVSAGNTGAYLALAKMILKTMPGIARPALASLVPTLHGECVMLDLGANVECDERNLLEFAIMGEMFARYVLSHPRPTVGLLNVGTEEGKGDTTVRKASELISQSSIQRNFKGYIEGDDITRGMVDVVVTNGFTGNAVLKAGEGVMHLALEYFRQAFRGSLMAKIGYLMARSTLRKMQMRLDYRRYNGGIWLGLNGVAIKSHGGADELGFAHALDLAVDMVASGVNEHIQSEFVQNISVENVTAENNSGGSPKESPLKPVSQKVI